MSATALRAMIHREPFIPLGIRLSNGESCTILHPELAMVLSIRIIIVGFPESDRSVTCSLIHVNSVRELDAIFTCLTPISRALGRLFA